VLFNEPKLLKFNTIFGSDAIRAGFSALQRAEIAEMPSVRLAPFFSSGFSALQRAEIAEM